jgi:DNA mismatch repair protein MutS2
MNAGTLRALEFDRIVAAVADLAVTPSGHERLLELHPLTDPAQVAAAQRATSEGTRLLADIPGFPLRAPSDLAEALDALSVEGRPLEPLRLLGLADYLESIDASRTTVKRATGSFPILTGLVDSIASFRNEIADVRRRIEPSGEVADHASPALARIRDRLRKLRARLRSTLDALVRGRETAKYLQDQVVTDRNGRYVVMVRAEHRGAIPGLVHGASSSGATLYLEPLDTVEINNDVVALQEEEAGEVRRILLELSDAFRGRPLDLRRTLDVATELDAIQARARFSVRLGGVEPAMSTDGTLDLRAARHPLLVLQARERRAGRADAEDVSSKNDSRPQFPVPVDIRLIPPVHILIIAGPNTGGKTVALKTAGLLALMAQAGLHVPADPGSRTPVFQAVFADIGDEQSIAASLSTFSAHITNVVSMDRMLRRPALILLDEVGAGTDPVEGGALGTAVIDHFRGRGAHLVATTHYDALKSYASTTAGVTGAAFGFDPDTFAPTYRLIYGSPGRSLAIEIAARLGMPSSVVQAARANMSDREQQLAEHLARVDRDLHAVEQERQTLARERATVAETERKLRAREEALREREAVVRRRAETRLDQQLRDARREIDAVLEGLKVRASELREARLSGIARTSEAGAARADARSAVDRAIEHARHAAVPEQVPAFAAEASPAARGPIVAGTRVRVGSLGMEGTVIDLHGRHAEVEVRGKRLRARADDLSPLAPAAAPPVKIRVDLQPRESSLSELNVIGCTVDEALDRVEKFLDEATVTDQRSIRIVHGHGTGQLRRGIAGFLKEHPLVARFETAPTERGGGGVTVVELKD